MFYVVALGNPGDEYRETRHNVGWLLADQLLATYQFSQPIEKPTLSLKIAEGDIAAVPVMVLYPTTYMNNSGVAVKKVLTKKDLSNLLVIHDDIALPLGEIRISIGRGAGGHNGIKSLIETFGTEQFARIRVGIAQKSFFTGLPKRPSGDALPRFVTGRFTKKELLIVSALAPTVAEAVSVCIREGVEKAMNVYN